MPAPSRSSNGPSTTTTSKATDMPQPLDVPRNPEKAVTLDAPVHLIEVQIGSLTATGRDGYKAKGKAGKTIAGAKLHVPITLIATESPCRVRVVYDSEAVAYERQRAAERKAAIH